MKAIKYILVFSLFFIFIKWTYPFIIIWGVIEVLIWSIRNKTFKRIRDFICNFVITILNCIDILLNIVLHIPANRILTTPSSIHNFGSPEDSFTKILRMNFLYGNLTVLGDGVYHIVLFFKKLLKKDE